MAIVSEDGDDNKPAAIFSELFLSNTQQNVITTWQDKVRKWDKFYIGLCHYMATASKDPSTKVGAVIVRPDFSVASVGFNGFPQKMEDREEWYNNREEKYSRVVHGEINAASFCRDQSLQGYTLYTTPFMPCDRCFVQMVQKGITRFVAPKATEDQLKRWGDAFEKVRRYARDCSVELVELDA